MKKVLLTLVAVAVAVGFVGLAIAEELKTETVKEKTYQTPKKEVTKAKGTVETPSGQKGTWKAKEVTTKEATTRKGKVVMKEGKPGKEQTLYLKIQQVKDNKPGAADDTFTVLQFRDSSLNPKTATKHTYRLNPSSTHNTDKLRNFQGKNVKMKVWSSYDPKTLNDIKAIAKDVDADVMVEDINTIEGK